jgi:hypothetical protein
LIRLSKSYSQSHITVPSVSYQVACANPSTSRRRAASFAEELGVHFGNGSLFEDRRWNKVGFDIYGNLYDDQPYLEFHVSRLIEDAFGIRPRTYVHPRSATLILRTLSEDAFQAKRAVGLRPGKKIHLRIPHFLQTPRSHGGIAQFLRGLFDIEGTLRFRKQFRDRHYYPVLECEMGDPQFVNSLHGNLTKLGLPTVFRVKRPRTEPPRRAKGAVCISGWKAIDAWLERLGFANAKHASKLLVGGMFGFCPAHTSLDERLAIIAGEIDPAPFYNRRKGDLVATPKYRYAHEVMMLRIAYQPQLLHPLLRKMKIRAEMTRSIVTKLVKSKELQIRRTSAGTEIKTSDSGVERLRILLSAWKQLRSKYGITIPDSLSYSPSAFQARAPEG